MKIKKYISLKIISLFAVCLWAAPQKCQAVSRFSKISRLVRSSYIRRSLCNMPMPNYAKQAIPHYSKTQNTYSKSNGVLYATLGISAGAVGIYEARNNRDIMHINGKSYYLYQQSATTAGLVTVSVSCPPVGAIIGCAALIIGGAILADVVQNASRESEGQHRYIPPPSTLSPYWQGKGLERAKPKGGRKRWKGPKGRLYEWDYEKGEIEAYDKTGQEHKGGFDAEDGHQRSPADPKRRIEP